MYMQMGMNMDMGMDIRGIPKPQHLNMIKLSDLRSLVPNHQSHDNADNN